jgi:hypothetical protein
MKFWFYIFLAINLGLGGLIYLTHNKPVDANVVQELHAEKLPLITAVIPPAQPVPAVKAPSVTAPPTGENAQPPSVATADNVAPPIAAAPVKPSQCLQWVNIKSEDIPRARAALAALQLGDKLSEGKNENILRYWVYIPVQDNKKLLDASVAALKKLGLSDYSVLDDNSISLGVFSTEEAATRHLEQMEIKGVRSARSGARTTQLRDVMFTIRDPAAAVTSKLNTLEKDYIGSAIKQTTC